MYKSIYFIVQRETFLLVCKGMTNSILDQKVRYELPHIENNDFRNLRKIVFGRIPDFNTMKLLSLIIKKAAMIREVSFEK